MASRRWLNSSDVRRMLGLGSFHAGLLSPGALVSPYKLLEYRLEPDGAQWHLYRPLRGSWESTAIKVKALLVELAFEQGEL